MAYKLNFELVPDSCWYSNLRSILPKGAWEIIKKDARVRSENKCAICGARAKILDAHEVWSYDLKSKTQKLEDVIAVCKDCHSVIHIGRTQLVGNEERAENHYMKVNNCSYADYKKALNEANLEHKKRNEIDEWKLDVSWLKKFD